MGIEKCPFCGQEIDTAASKCFFCGAELNKESVHKRLEQLHMQDIQSERRIHKPLLIKVVVILIFVGVVFFYGTSSRKHMSDIGISGRTSAVKLSAEVTFEGEQLTISNNDSFDWKNVTLEIIPESIAGRFNLSVPIILSGETYKAEAKEFLNDEGISFNTDKIKPSELWIRCDTSAGSSGSYMADWQ